MRVRRLILAAGAIAAVACSDSGNGDQGPDETPEGDVLVRNDFFDPSELEAVTGATVVWAWASNGTEHDILFDDGPTSGDKVSGTFERTFTAAGDYPYHCTIHGPSMNGVITVGAPGGGGGGGGGNPPPAGPGDPGY